MNHLKRPVYTLTPGVPMGRVSSHIPVSTDAYLTDWGGVCQTRAVENVVSVGTPHLLQLETVLLVLIHFSHRLQGRDVLVWSDNRTTVSYINRQGEVRSSELHLLAERLWLWAHGHLRSLTDCHIQGSLNEVAGLMS